jgi:hypothetical protein
LSDLKNQAYGVAILRASSKLKAERISLELLGIISDHQQSWGYDEGP